MTNYDRGYQTEIKIVNNYRENGHYATRTAGSHTLFDVIAFVGNEIHTIQAKRTKKDVCFTDFEEDIEELKNFKTPWNVHKFLWVWKDYKGWVIRKKIKKKRKKRYEQNT